MSNIEARVKTIIAEQLDVKIEDVKNEASYVDDLGADSLGMVELVMALEEEFGTDISDDDAEKLLTVQLTINYINEHQGAFAMQQADPDQEAGIRRILTHENPNHVHRFVKRIFCQSELDAFQQRHEKVLQLKKGLDTGICENEESSLQQDKYDRALWRLSSWVAGRFAAKEAAMKAVSPQRLGWHHAEVLVPPGQMKPLLVIHSFKHADTAERNGENPVRKHAAQLSISHDGEYAIATVLAAIH